MAERIYNGWIYAQNPQTGEWDPVSPAPQQQAAPASRGVIIQDPYRPRAEARAEGSDERAWRAEARADRAETRAEREARIREEERAARGGADTTEGERKAAFLATRLAGGLTQLGQIGSSGAPSLLENTVGRTSLGNYITDADWQRTKNAQLDMLDAALTLGTGAAYTREQLEGYRSSYFPEPGESQASIADKQRRLQLVLQAARINAGAAAPQIDRALENAGYTFADDGSLGTPVPANQVAVDPSQYAAQTETVQANPLTQEQFQAFMQQARNAFAAGASREEMDQLAASYGMGAYGPDLDAAIQARSQGVGATFANPENPQDYWQNAPVSQALSGLNEGIANALGFPVDVANMAIGAGATGINSLFGTNLQAPQNPVLGSEWIKGAMGDAILPESNLSGRAPTRRIAESIGGALLPSAAAGAVGRAGLGLLSGLGGGIGAATANEVAPDNIWAELAGELVGGAGVGVGAAARARSASRAADVAAIPSIDDLKARASDKYKLAEANGVTASQPETALLAGAFRRIASDEGLISPTGRVSEAYPKAKEALSMADDFANGEMNVKQMQAFRRTLSDAKNSTESAERRVASALLNEFDDFTAPLAPELSEARDIASRYLSAETIDRARELAGARAGQFTGSGYENALRTDFRALDRNIIKERERGFNPAVVEAIQNVARGTPVSNAARNVGKLAPTGVVSAGLATGVPFSIGNAIGGPVVGGIAATAVPAIGAVGRNIATNIGIRNADLAEALARNGGAIQYSPVDYQGIADTVAAALTPDVIQQLNQEGRR